MGEQKKSPRCNEGKTPLNLATKGYPIHKNKKNGSVLAHCWRSFGVSGAPGRASGGSMCPKGGLDPFLSILGVSSLPRGWILRVLGSI